MAQRSKFFILPAELRNQIYELLLPDYSKVFISRICIIQPPALSQVCHQIRAEFSSYLPRRFLNTHTLTFKAIDCGFRHVVQAHEALTPDETDDLECLKLIVSLTEDEVLHSRRLVYLADTLFATDWIDVPEWRGSWAPNIGHWELVAEVGDYRKNIRHEFVVDMEHTASEFLSCSCSKLARKTLSFPPVRKWGKSAPSPGSC